MRKFLEVLISWILEYDLRFILNIVQPATHWTQRLIGWNCLAWAKIFKDLFFVILFFCGGVQIIVHNYFTGPINIFLAIYFARYYTKEIQMAGDRIEKNTEALRMNLNIVKRCGKRLILIVLISQGLILDLINLTRHGPIFFLVSLILSELPLTLVYLTEVCIACTPLPPKKSKLRELSEKMVRSVKEALAPGDGGAIPVPA